MKKYNLCKVIILFLIIMATLTGCGRPRSVNSLYTEAKRNHGDCTIVSNNKTDKKTTVVLHDKLQNFNYEVSSYMMDITIDGASFGSMPTDSDTFEDELRKKVLENTKAEFDEICENNNVHYEFGERLIVFAPDAKTAENASLEFSKIIQKHNLQSRLDGLTVYAGGNEKYWDNEHFGSVVLPNIKWRNPEDELIEYYTEMAHMQTDENAVYIRTEKGTFQDTGAELEKVGRVLGTSYPENMNDEVTFYYFKSSSGKEYYICNFNYYDEDYYQMKWYTNYTE